ncbi:hypothetical protein ACLI4Z_10170 [Natrialbaceae archaeon A-arb3/5]
MNRPLTAFAALVTLFASIGWISSGGDIAARPAVFGIVSGFLVTVFHHRSSQRATAAGIVVAIIVVVSIIVLNNETALFFGAVTTASIVVTNLTLGLRSSSATE